MCWFVFQVGVNLAAAFGPDQFVLKFLCSSLAIIPMFGTAYIVWASSKAIAEKLGLFFTSNFNQNNLFFFGLYFLFLFFFVVVFHMVK